ncbi:PqqD family peptide modification chaperone [Streptomyces thermoalcalitolerans]|uniref:Uncharacterized protein n=1 Tax=Streptomyces thermoalcalitolerans TaxID=65605 RepID=A0ABN1NJ48_9ACTN
MVTASGTACPLGHTAAAAGLTDAERLVDITLQPRRPNCGTAASTPRSPARSDSTSAARKKPPCDCARTCTLTGADHGKVLLNGSAGTYRELNPVGGLVVAALLGGGPVEEIAGTLCAESGRDEDQPMADVTALLSAPRGARLLRS